MFLPPKLTTSVLTSLAILLLFAGSAEAQQAEFNRRAAAMAEARARAQQPQSVRLVSNEDEIGVDYSAPPSPTARTRVARVPRSSATRQMYNSPNQRVVLGQSHSGAPVNSTSNQVISRYVPRHLRTAQLSESVVVDGGSPIVDSGTPVYEEGIIEGEVIEGGCDSCGGCGDSGAYFDQCDSCCGRGGCPPGPCWISGLGELLYNGEYFFGATSFRSELFPTVGGATGDLSNDQSFGFQGGFNFGLPLCKITCGLFSGQIGMRFVTTNFNGNEFSADDRNQTYLTWGFFRRVDYGLQAGIVVDHLREEWITTIDLTQLRGDVGWVYPNGSTLGFRYAANLDDDTTIAENLFQSTRDNYRFYARRMAQSGGYGEGFLGWTDNSQTILGLDYDLPVRERMAMQAGFTYFLGEEGVPAGSNQAGGNAQDAFNIYVGFVLRPRGTSYYRFYDRPLMPVADNGTMLIKRD